MADKLKEYLIGLGFKVDDASYAKFKSAIARAGSATAELGAGAIETAAAIGYEVAKIARHYSTMAYSAQRTQSTVGNLRAMELAFKQIGLDVEGAKSTLESFASVIRTNAGAGGILRAFGVDTSKDKLDQMVDLVDKLKGRFAKFGQPGYAAAANFAAQFGIDERTFFQMWENGGRLRTELDKQKEKMREAGLDTKKMGDSAQELDRMLNSLGDTFSRLKERIYEDFVTPVGIAVDKLDQLLSKGAELDKKSSGWLGIAAGVGGVFTGGWLTKKILGAGRRLLFGAPEAGEAAKGTAKAGEGAGAAAAEKELASGAARAFIKGLVRLMGLTAGFYFESTQPAQGGKEIYRKNENGEWELTPFGRSIVGDEKPDDEKPAATPPGGKKKFEGGMFGGMGFRPADWDKHSALAPSPGGGTAVLNQKTEINVTTSGDERSSAREIASLQGRVNGDAVRNLRGATS